MERDAFATLRHVAALGFGEVEFAGAYGNPPEALCAETRKLGLGVAAAHADWQTLRRDPLAAIAEAKALCAHTIMLAWLPPEERRTREQWEDWINHLNRANELARAEGLALAYHAHDFEFEQVGGKARFLQGQPVASAPHRSFDPDGLATCSTSLGFRGSLAPSPQLMELS